jgi:AcrR family transcriptional regulator
MHSNKNSSEQSSEQAESTRTFIEQARRAQIIEATIEVLAEYGYSNLSFARIAKHASISPSLISYHFRDKKELLNEVLFAIGGERVAHMQHSIATMTSATDKLRAAIEVDLAHMGTHPKRFQALVEITFNMRSAKGTLIYMGDIEDPGLTALREILEMGQKNGEFAKFDAGSVAMIIDAAMSNFLAQFPLRPSFNLESFTANLVDVALLIAKKGTHE